MKNDTPKVCAVFALVAELSVALGVPDMDQLLGCWEHEVEPGWMIAVNVHGHESISAAPVTKKWGKHTPVVLSPYHIAVWRRGKVAGLVSPGGGLSWTGASEKDFVRDLKKAIKEARP